MGSTGMWHVPTIISINLAGDSCEELKTCKELLLPYFFLIQTN